MHRPARPGGDRSGRGTVAEGGTHWVVRLNGRNRATFFLGVLAMLALHLRHQQVGALHWTLLVLQFAVYPGLIYWRAVR